MTEALLVVQRIPLAKYLKRVKVARQNIELAGIFKSLLKSLVFKIRQAAPCFVCNLDMWIGLPADGSMEIFATGHVVKEAPSSSLEIISSRRHMSSIKESPAPCMFPRALADRVENQAKKALEKFELGDKSDLETGQFALDEEVKSGENGGLAKSAIARKNTIIMSNNRPASIFIAKKTR